MSHSLVPTNRIQTLYFPQSNLFLLRKKKAPQGFLSLKKHQYPTLVFTGGIFWDSGVAPPIYALQLLPILASQGSRSKVNWASSGAIEWEIIAFCVRSEMTSLLSLPPRLDIAAKFTTEARYAGFF
ncbi:hypothetical protein SM12_05458 [Klebsiella pneumoniae]|nr:hypothetical protein SM12_05458 [Klebsiella pneumoniae]